MLIFRVLFLFLVVAFGAPACAGLHSHGSPSIGNAQLNLGGGDYTAQTFINLFNSVNDISFAGGATPAAVDIDSYPVRNFSGVIGGTAGFADKTLSTTGPWILSWPAGRSFFRIVFLKPGTASTVTGSPVLSNNAGSGNLTIEGGGVAGSVTITWNDTSSVLFQFDGTYTSWASNTSGVISLVRASDAASFAVGNFYTPEFVSFILALHPRAIRPMGWNLPRNLSVDSNVTTWAYRKRTTALSFVAPNDFAPNTRAGGATSFGSTSYNASTGVFTVAAAVDTPLGGWVNGETLTANNITAVNGLLISNAVAKTGANAGKVQLTVPSTTGLVISSPVAIAGNNNNGLGTTEADGRHTILSVDSSTTFTIDVTFVHTFDGTKAPTVSFYTLAITGKSGGAKLLLNNSGEPIGYVPTITTDNATYVYDSVLDSVLYTAGGISNQPPIEVQAQLANKVNANLWYNLPPWATDDYVTNVANAAFSNLNTNLNFVFEYANENWNFSFPSTQWMFQRAIALGLTINLDYEGLRLRQIHGNLLPATSWGSSPRLERFYGYQAFQGGTGFPGSSIATQQGWFNGINLVSPGTAAYQTFVGGSAVNYNTAPNRPIDFTTAIGYAPYTAGLGLSGQSPDLGNLAPLASDAVNLQSIATNYNAGGAGITTAIATIDGLIRGTTLNKVQTVTASGTTFTTPLAHGYNVGDLLRFTVAGGTTYSGVDVKTLYFVATTPLTTTFTMQPIVHGSAGSTVNAGSAGSGTTSVGMAGIISSQNIFDLQNVFTAWELMAANYDSSRAAAGLTNLKVEWYEGALEPTAPTTAQCSNIGISSGDCATIATALVAWKNDPLAALTIQTYYKSFKGTDAAFVTSGAMPHSVAPSQLVLMGGGAYGLNSNFSFVSPSTYQLYNGFAAFSTP